jgi:hypothetical protein
MVKCLVHKKQFNLAKYKLVEAEKLDENSLEVKFALAE